MKTLDRNTKRTRGLIGLALFIPLIMSVILMALMGH